MLLFSSVLSLCNLYKICVGFLVKVITLLENPRDKRRKGHKLISILDFLVLNSIC